MSELARLEALLGRGAFDDARALVVQAKLETSGVGQFTMGMWNRARRNVGEALGHFANAVERDPTQVRAFIAFAQTLVDLGQPAQACDVLQAALQVHPGRPDLLSTVGNIFSSMGSHDRAIAAHRESVRAMPNHPEVVANLGVALQAAGQLEEAQTWAERALALEPSRADLVYNLGTVLLERKQLDRAEEQLKRTLALNPSHVRAHVNMGEIFNHRDQVAEAASWFRKAASLDATFPDAHWNLAIALLTQGAYQEGFAEYEWRMKMPPIASKMRLLPSKPLWDGSKDPQRRLLITAEQGFGDTVQFVRFVREVRERVGAVVVEVQPPLVSLLKSTLDGVHVIGRGDAVPDVDTFVPLLSLPHVLQASNETWGRPAYLRADAGRIAQWRDRLGSGPIVAIGWQGNPTYGKDAKRSIPLEHFAPLLEVPGVKFVSLQKNHGLDQLDKLPPQVRARIQQLDDLDAGADAFLDTAAVLTLADLVICSDTSLPHLAGALGRPTWMAVSKHPDWRWAPREDATDWYPSMRLFRQQESGDWASVFESIRKELVAWKAALGAS